MWRLRAWEGPGPWEGHRCTRSPGGRPWAQPRDTCPQPARLCLQGLRDALSALSPLPCRLFLSFSASYSISGLSSFSLCFSPIRQSPAATLSQCDLAGIVGATCNHPPPSALLSMGPPQTPLPPGQSLEQGGPLPLPTATAVLPVGWRSLLPRAGISLHVYHYICLWVFPLLLEPETELHCPPWLQIFEGFRPFSFFWSSLVP